MARTTMFFESAWLYREHYTSFGYAGFGYTVMFVSAALFGARRFSAQPLTPVALDFVKIPPGQFLMGVWQAILWPFRARLSGALPTNVPPIP
jgi:hypothetical protein